MKRLLVVLLVVAASAILPVASAQAYSPPYGHTFDHRPHYIQHRERNSQQFNYPRRALLPFWR